MHNLPVLDLAAGVLAVTGLHAELFSASAIFEDGSSLNDNDEDRILKRLGQSIQRLSRQNDLMPREHSTETWRLSDDVAALRELAFEYLQDCRLLLEKCESARISLSEKQGSQPRNNDTVPSVVLMLRGQHSMERIEQLVHEVTDHTRSIIRCV
jgi:hypothetical protein